MRTTSIFQKKPAFRWDLQARARSPQWPLGTHTTSGGGGCPSGRMARSRPKTSLLVFLETFRTLALEKTVPGIYTLRAGGLWESGKRHARETTQWGKLWQEVRRQLFLPPMPGHRSASLRRLVPRNIFYHTKTAAEGRSLRPYHI